MKRLIGWILGIAVAAAALVAIGVRVPAVQDRLMRAGIERMVADRPDELFEPDALRVLLCGTASPLPHPTRAKACVAVFAAGKFWIVDTGSGSWNRMALLRVDASRIGAILLTHFHSDHIGDLGEFNLNTWAMGRPTPLRVFGPPGVERVVAGFREAYTLDEGYRIAHHGAGVMNPETWPLEAVPIAGPADGSGPQVVLEDDGLRITAFAVHHDPVTPAYGYRFDYRGRSVVVSGDTIKWPGLIEAARGADVLVHEAQANQIVAMIGEAAAQADRPRVAKIMHDIPSYHTSPVEAAEVANEAGREAAGDVPPDAAAAVPHRRVGLRARRHGRPPGRVGDRRRRVADRDAGRFERHHDANAAMTRVATRESRRGESADHEQTPPGRKRVASALHAGSHRGLRERPLRRARARWLLARLRDHARRRPRSRRTRSAGSATDRAHRWQPAPSRSTVASAISAIARGRRASRSTARAG